MKNSSYTMAMINMFSDYILPRISLDGTICQGIENDIDYIFSGANGCAIKFKCKNGKTYTIKFYYFWQEYASEITPEHPEYIRIYLKNVNQEFNNIKLFNSENIVKTYGKFEYKNNKINSEVSRASQIQ